MKIETYGTEEEWLDARRGRITGSKLKDIIVKRGTGKKIGFYQLIADRIAEKSDGSNAMYRGKELEGEAVERFRKETGKKVDDSLVIWSRDDNYNIAYSPDGSIGKTEAVEAKCKDSARHIEAFLTQKIPDDNYEQIVQAFIVNEKLKKLYMVFYDPRMRFKDFFFLTIERKTLEEDIEKYMACEIAELEEVERIVASLTNF